MQIKIDFHGEMGVIKSITADNNFPLPDVNDTIEINMEEFVVEDRNFVFEENSVLIEIFLSKEFDEEEEEFDEEEYTKN